MITVENLFDGGEVQAFDDLWNAIAQRRAAANLPPAATLMKAHTTIDEVIGIFKNQRLVGCIETLLGGEVELIGSQLMFNPPGSVGFSQHQDFFFAPTGLMTSLRFGSQSIESMWKTALSTVFPVPTCRAWCRQKKITSICCQRPPKSPNCFSGHCGTMANNGTRMLAPWNALSIPRYLPQSRKSR